MLSASRISLLALLDAAVQIRPRVARRRASGEAGVELDGDLVGPPPGWGAPELGGELLRPGHGRKVRKVSQVTVVGGDTMAQLGDLVQAG